MTVLTILVGIPGSGKSMLAYELIQLEKRVYVNADDICPDLFGNGGTTGDRNDAVFQSIKPELERLMKAGQPIVLDARLRLAKYRRPYVDLAKAHGYRAEAIFLNVPLELAIENNRQSAEDGGRGVAESVIRRYERHMRIPTYAEGFDRIEVQTPEPINEVAAQFFDRHEERLINDPVGLIRELERDGSLALWLPELYDAIPIDQHNPHHQFTVYEHILKATETVAGTELKFVWTMLLHDIGKAYPGIKQFTGFFTEAYGKWKRREKVVIENGADIREGRDSGEFYVVKGTKVPKEAITTDLAGHFYDHENLGAQLAFRILMRFGYAHDFALEVATLIQFHMMMPRDIENASMNEIRAWYDRVGSYAPDLMLVRLADTRGK
ncbi:MAG: AAA family ATPase [Tumebacillaceae bacterium]